MKLKVSPILCLVLCLPIIYLHFFTEPYARGFSCDDDSIRHPFLPLQIKLHILLSYAFVVPALFVLAVEFHQRRTVSESIEVENKPYFYQTYKEVVKYNFGLLFNFLFCTFVKVFVGRLRPHTVEFCHIERECSSHLVNQYIEEFKCENSDYPRYLNNVRMSFFSGHASIAFYAGCYIVVYLRSRIKHHRVFYPFYLLLLIVSAYPGYTQWNNYWHFASDVLVGYFVGAGSAIATFRYTYCASTRKRKQSDLDDSTLKSKGIAL